jgi:hypothetical protein
MEWVTGAVYWDQRSWGEAVIPHLQLVRKDKKDRRYASTITV